MQVIVGQAHNAEHDALQDRLPPVAEVLELVALHLAALGKAFNDELEQNDPYNHQQDEDHKERVARQEDVGDLNVRSETNPFDAADCNHAVRLGLTGVGVGPAGQAAEGARHELVHYLERPLLYLDRGRG